MLAWFVIAIGAAATCSVVVWFWLTRNHPENADSHVEEPTAVDGSGRGTGQEGVADRPAGPDAENMASEPSGGLTPPGTAGDIQR